MERAAAAGTSAGIDVQRHLLARQMIGQAGAVIRYTPGLLRTTGRHRRQLGRRPGDIGIEVFQAEL
jgi:hypothetical protein